MILLERYKAHLNGKASQMCRDERAFALRRQSAPWLQLPVIPILLRWLLKIENPIMDWVVGISIAICLLGIGMVVRWFYFAPFSNGRPQT